MPRLLNLSFLALFAVYLINFFFLGFLIGPFDYDHLSGYWEIAFRFWKTDQPSADFNPFLCGGRTLGADPQIPIYHPFVLLVPLLGPTLLIKWEMLCQLGLGLYGLWILLGHFNVAFEKRIWGLFLYASGGAVIAKFLVGHVTLGFYLLYPLFIAFSYHWEQVRGSRDRIALIGYWILFIYCGAYKPNFIVYGLLPLFVEHSVRGLFSRNARPFIYFCVGVALCALLNASHYLPSWKYFHDFPRVDGTHFPRIPFYTLIANVLLPLKSIPKAWYGDGFLQRHEYNIFLGPVALWFAGRFIFFRPNLRSPKGMGLLALLFVSVILGMGTNSEGFSFFSPYSWARELWPGFQTIRVPTRFWYGAYLSLIVFSAIGFQWPKNRKGQIFLFALGILPLLLMSFANLFKTSLLATHNQFSPSRSYPADHQWALGQLNHEDSYTHLRQGVGVLECVENLENYRCFDLQEGPLLKLIFSDSTLSEWRATWRNWSSFSFSAKAKDLATIKLNMSHSPFWQVQGEGVSITSRFGEPLTLEVKGGEWNGELLFHQPWQREGVWINGISAAFFCLFAFWWALWPWWLERRRKHCALSNGD